MITRMRKFGWNGRDSCTRHCSRPRCVHVSGTEYLSIPQECLSGERIFFFVLSPLLSNYNGERIKRDLVASRRTSNDGVAQCKNVQACLKWKRFCFWQHALHTLFFTKIVFYSTGQLLVFYYNSSEGSAGNTSARTQNQAPLGNGNDSTESDRLTASFSSLRADPWFKIEHPWGIKISPNFVLLEKVKWGRHGW